MALQQESRLFQFQKKMRAIMPDEIQLSSFISFKKPSLIHQYIHLDVNDEAELVKKYLHSLTYDPCTSDLKLDLESEELHTLKYSLTLLHRAYKAKKITLLQIQGVWPLLTFIFTKFSGLQLYLAFQKLIQPIQKKQSIPNVQSVKEQQLQFDPKKFFQNSNNWLHDKKFLAALRVIQKTCVEPSFKGNIKKFRKVFQVILEEENELLVKQKQISKRYDEFKSKAKQIWTPKRYKNNENIVDQLGLEQIMKGYVMSDPGDFSYVLSNFQRKDFINIQACQHEEFKTDKQLVKSLYNHPIKQETSEKQLSQKKIYEPTEIRSTPTKRKIAVDKISNEFVQSPSKTRNLYRRPPRFKFIERLYKLEEENEKKKNNFKQVKKQVKKQKEKSQKIKQTFFNLQKRNKKKLKKIDRSYYSDQEKITKRKRVSKREVNDEQLQEEFWIQESVSYSSQEKEDEHERMSQRMQIQSSEQITIKRKKPTKRAKSPINKRTFMEDENQAVHVVEIQSQNYYSHGEYIQPRSNIINGESNKIRLKQCPSLKFLKLSKPREEQKYTQSLQNISMRMLELNEAEQIYTNINVSEYVWYLQSLEGNQIQKQIKSVCKQLLARQYHQHDLDMHVKILGLYIMSQNKRKQHSPALWDKYKQIYIVPLLQHCLSVTIYTSLSQILNNLAVGSLAQDLTNLSKTKRYFHFFFEIINHFDYIYNERQKQQPRQINNQKQQQKQISLLCKFVKLLYDLMPSSSKIQNQLKNKYRSFLIINIDSPFKIGTSFLKFKLSPKEQVIAYSVAVFIFQHIFIHEYAKSTDNFTAVRKDYMKPFGNDVTQADFYNKQQMIMFNSFIKKFYNIYRPQVDKHYFSSLVNLIIVCLQNLMRKINNVQQQSREIKAQSSFLQSVIRNYLQYQSKDVNFNTKPAILSWILVSSNLSKKYKELIPQKIQTMSIYPRSLATLWNYKQYRSKNKKLLQITKKYVVEGIEKNLKNNSLQVKNRLVTESLSYFIKTIYKARLYENLSSQNSNFHFSDLKADKSNINNENISYFTLHNIIRAHFTQLDRFLDENISFYNKCKSQQQKKKVPIKNSQIMLIQFLNTFILLNPRNEEVNQINQDSVFKHSILHYFFCLEFILEQNFFLKYYKYKINSRIDIVGPLLEKCSQIINFFFGHHPTFIDKLCLELKHDKTNNQYNRFEDEDTQSFKENARLKKRHTINEQLTKQYYKMIKEHFDSRKNMETEALITQADQLSNINTLANIYSTHLMCCIDAFGPHSTSSSLQNPITRNITDSIKTNGVTCKKIQKAIYFVACIFKHIEQYIQFKLKFSKQSAYTGIKSVKSEMVCGQIKKFIYKNVIKKHAKQIVTLITCGFALKNSVQFSDIPLGKIIQSFSTLQLVEKSNLLERHSQEGYIHFLYAMQCMKTKGGLADIFNHLLSERQFKDKEFNSKLSQTLVKICDVMKKLLLALEQRPFITIESLKILTFVVRWEQLTPQCFKLYKNQMQIISKGQSLILKIPLTQKNIQIILQLFDAVERCKYDHFKIKSIPNQYIDQFFEQQKLKNNQKELCDETQIMLRCLHDISNSQSLYTSKAVEIIQKLAEKFIQPILKSPHSSQINVSKRIHIFYEMVGLSCKQIIAYQNIVIANKQAFQKLVRFHHPSPEIHNFQQFVLKLMIAEHSNFFNIKAFISSQMRQNVLSEPKKEYFKKVISKLKQKMERVKANPFLIKWCQEELTKLNGQAIKNQDLSSWMDLQQQ